MRLLLPMVLWVLLLVPCWGEQPVRPGPALHPAPKLPALLSEDPRLAKPVTLRLDIQPLSVVVAALAKETGATLRAAREVADEPATIRMTGRPANVVMHHLALLFNFRWRRTGDEGRWRYELFQDPGARQVEITLRERAQRRPLEGLMRQLRLATELARRPVEELARERAAIDARVLAHSQRLRGMAPEERLAARQSPESLRLVGSANRADLYALMQRPVPRAVVPVLAALGREQWQALLDEEVLTFGSRAEADVLPLPAPVTRELRALRPTMLIFRGPESSPNWVARQEERERQLQEQWEQAREVRVRVQVRQVRRIHPRDYELEIRTATLAPEGDWRAVDQYAAGLTLTGGADAESQEVDCSEAVDPEAVPAAWRDDPVLGARQRLTPDLPRDPWSERDWMSDGPLLSTRELLPQIAAACEIDLIADAYRCPRILHRVPPGGEERPLYSFLNRYVLMNARWTREGEIFHVRHYDWHLARLEEIPPRLADAWSARLRQNPRLSLADAAALDGALSDEQLRVLPEVLRARGVWLGQVFDSQIAENMQPCGRKEMLRAFAALPTGQQQALLQGRAVGYAELPRPARRWLRKAVLRRQQAEPLLQLPRGVEGSTLRLTSQPLQREVSSQAGRFWTLYSLPGGKHAPDITGKGLGGPDESALDRVRPAPDLIPPQPGPATQALFHVQTQGGPPIVFGIILPHAERRKPTVDAPAPTSGGGEPTRAREG